MRPAAGSHRNAQSHGSQHSRRCRGRFLLSGVSARLAAMDASSADARRSASLPVMERPYDRRSRGQRMDCALEAEAGAGANASAECWVGRPAGAQMETAAPQRRDQSPGPSPMGRSLVASPTAQPSEEHALRPVVTCDGRANVETFDEAERLVAVVVVAHPARCTSEALLDLSHARGSAAVGHDAGDN
jgi:hypothetical protein